MPGPATPLPAALPDPDLDLGWALGTLLRAYLRHAGAAIRDVPGGPRGYQVLSIAGSGRCRSQAAIADRVGLDRTVLTYLIDDLEAHKLVRRTPDPGDRRARQVTLTAKGTGLLARMAELTGAIERELLAGVADDDADHFRAVLFTAAHNVEDASTGENVCDIAASIAATS